MVVDVCVIMYVDVCVVQTSPILGLQPNNPPL